MNALKAVALVGLLVASHASAEEAPARGNPPSLEELRRIVLEKGVRPKLASIESAGPAASADATSETEGVEDASPRRLVFWTKTERITQCVVVAVLGAAIDTEDPAESEETTRFGAYVRVQSGPLARVGADHPRFAELAEYMLDRNFARAGAQCARDAADGEVVVRADVPCSRGVAGDDFVQALESVLGAADEESVRIAAILGE